MDEPPGKELLTDEQRKLGRSLAKRNRILGAIWKRIPLLRIILAVAGAVWIAALPHPALWKNVRVDEHALQPAQVTMYFDWSNVHKADTYLAELEAVASQSLMERTAYLRRAFSLAGLAADNTSLATYAHVTPPRSSGTEAILVSANWRSRDGGPNLRGVATILALGDFLRGQNHWAFDFYLVVGEGYLEGLEEFMTSHHHRANIWTGLNIDYPGHSFSHLGVFYEGVNGRLPNQDVINTVSRVAKYSGGVETRLHTHLTPTGDYFSAARHLIDHFKYAAFGRPSAAHGLLAKHRIDAVTLYASPAEGPHGFYTLGRTIESTLRSFNNLLERLHASFFFYLLPQPDYFLPVGHYLPAAVLLGASVTIGGFDCPEPLLGVMWMLPAFALGSLGWVLQSPLVSLFAQVMPRPTGAARLSLLSLAHLFYGALIPTLAMVNFPQAVLLAIVTILNLAPMPRWIKLALLPLHPFLLPIDLKAEWNVFGNVAWPAIFAIWTPLAVIAAIT